MGNAGKQSEQRIDSYPAIQILTIEELLHGAMPKMPPHLDTHKQAQRVQATPQGERMEFAELAPDETL